MPTNKRTSPDPKTRLAILLLLLLVTGVYGNSLLNGFVSDDVGLVQNGEKNLTVWFLFHSFPLLIPQLFHSLNYFLFDLNPWGFRITNLLFHSGNVVMIYLLIAQLKNRRLAFGGAALFAVHPLLSEPINWISAVSYLQYTFFFLTSFFLYIRTDLRTKPNWHSNLLAALFYLFALLSSVFAIPLVLIFYAYEFILGDLKKTWLKLLPFAVLALIWVAWFALAIPTRLMQTGSFAPVENFYNPLQSIPFVIGTYLKLIFWPRELTFAHVLSFPNQTSYLLTYLTNIVITLIYCLFLIVAFKKNRWLFFWGSFFLISLSISLLPLKLGSTFAERYAYLPTSALTVIVATLGTQLVSFKRFRKIGYLLFFVVLLAFSTRTIIRNFDWKDEVTLLSAALKVNPNIPKAYYDLGYSFYQKADYEKAAANFQQYLKTEPSSSANFYLATSLLKMGKTDEAISHLQKAIQIDGKSLVSLQLLAEIYFERQDWEKALFYTQKEIEIDPNNSTLYLNLGKIYLQLKQNEAAKNALEKSLQLNPQNRSAQEYLRPLNN